MFRMLYCAVAALPLLCCGCLPYVYPSLCHLPPVEVNSAGDEVTAFRVTVSESRTQFIGSTASPTLAFTAQDDTLGTTPRSSSVHLNRGVLLFMLFPIAGTHPYTCTKLYRRGYRTVVQEPWSDTTRAEWVEACDPEERYQAIRDLLYATPWHSAPERLDSSEPGDDRFPRGHPNERTGWQKGDYHPTMFHPRVRPGSWSKQHLKGLEFARHECADLLKQAEMDEPLRKQIEYLMHRLDEVIER